MNEDEQIMTTHVGCTIADVFGEFNFRKAADAIKAVNTYINILFPTTKEYGGHYTNFEEYLKSYQTTELEDAAKTVILWGKEYINRKFTDDMISRMHKAIESYAEHFPNNPIYKQALKEFD